MNANDILALTREGLSVVLWVCLPIVLVATVTALLVAMGQTVTQIQDQSIGQSARLIAVLGAIVVTAGWLGREVMHFAERALQLLGMPT
jgi:type III secretion protein S